MENPLNLILDAKENRHFLREKISQKNRISVSLSLNVAGYPKSNSLINSFFMQIVSDLKTFLLAHRVFISQKDEQIFTDEAGDFFLTSIKNEEKSEAKIKEITEKFEETHTLGRIIDVDITSKTGKPVSSGKEKICYFCNEKPAIVCMRNKNHTYKELRDFVFLDIENYLQEKRLKKIEKKLTETAIKSLLYEVSLSPKPGLVDFFNSGSHSDMDFFSFLNSTASLSPFFSELIEAGFSCPKNKLSEALPKIRNIGLQMEKAMFEATNGVNTQKGLIFLLGINLFASGVYFFENESFNEIKYRKIISEICKDLSKNELYVAKKAETHGEKCFKKYGKLAGGARAEAENAFPTVFNFSLPVLEKFLDEIDEKSQKNIEFALKKTLVLIIASNNDTNILFRKDLETLKQLQNISKLALNHADFEQKYAKIIDFCKKQIISPGGSADLLAITIYIYFIKKYNFQK